MTSLGDRLQLLIWRKPASTLAERTRRRVVLHLIPYLFFLYILAYLDRVNVSAAELKMCKPPEEGGLGFNPGIIGFGGGLFFWSYMLLEIPSTVSVVHWGARWVFVRILVLWGLCATAVGFIGLPAMSRAFNWLPMLPENSSLGILSSAALYINHLRDDARLQFYFFRLLLGFFEGGFFPSVIVYLSQWFRAQDRGKAIAVFMAAIPLSNVVGLPLSRLLLDVDWFHLAGWRWIFIVEGIPPIVAGFATLFLLPDRPSKAVWLPADERDWLLRELETEHNSKQAHGLQALSKHYPIVLLLTAVYVCINLTSYGLTIFMPRIIQSQSGASDETATLLATLPYVVGLVAMLINGWHSDRTGERIWHAAIPLALWSIGLGLTALLTGRVLIVPMLMMILLVGPFLYAHLPAFWPIPTMFLGATAAAAAIGFINMIGNLGGFFGPYLVGGAATKEDGTSLGLAIIAPWPLLAALIVLLIAYLRRNAPAKSPP
jgi:MFS transporter, ACS family, tartrate transporter